MAPTSSAYRSLATPSQDGSYSSASTHSRRLQPPSVRRRKIEIEVVEEPRGPAWMFPGGGSAHHVHVPADELAAIEDRLRTPTRQLSQWPATAICGNDILSSVLYSASSVSLKTGKLMPLPLLLVSVVLYFFRFIYEEVVSAIPLNGGSYNGLLNTTSKRTASVAACLGILSYVATGVVSATSGVHYLAYQVAIPIVPSVVALLFVFAVIAFLGITESSRIALVIFLHHILVLAVLFVTCVVYGVQHPHVLEANLHEPYPSVDVAGNLVDGTVATAVFFGFGASMLGITGFESSAQFVEQQQPGVFRQTLRNMWALASVFNVALAVGILAVLPLSGVGGIYDSADALLAVVARVAGGRWLEVWVCIDAFVVLSGAVLTSYVGIAGLVTRLATDRVVPAFLASLNAWRHTPHWILTLYFLLAASLVVVLDADATVLNGVYTYAFLGLMALFACSCMLLKAKRAGIPRDVHAPTATVVLGFVLVLVAILANLLGDPQVLVFFALYFLAVALVVFFMLERGTILRALLGVLAHVAPSRHNAKFASEQLASPTTLPSSQQNHTGARGGQTIAAAIVKLHELPIVFFAKHADLTTLNKAVVYVRRNEHTHTLRVVHVYRDSDGYGDVEAAEASQLRTFQDMVALLDHMYPKLRVDFVSVAGEFTPALVEWLAVAMAVPKNMMFIKAPGNFAAHRVATSGVRVITA